MLWNSWLRSSEVSEPSRRTGMRRLSIEQFEPRRLLATFQVTNTDASGPGSFRQAVEDANAMTGPDTISLAAGEYTLPSNFVLTESVTIEGAGPEETVLRPNGSTNPLHFQGNLSQVSSFELRNLSVRGQTNDGGSLVLLEALHASGEDSLTVENIVLENNTVEDGAALFVLGVGQVAVASSSIQNNSFGIFSRDEVIINVHHDETDTVEYPADWEVSEPKFAGGTFQHSLLNSSANLPSEILIENTRAFTNPITSVDVSRDGFLSAVDALRVINQLNRGTTDLTVPIPGDDLALHFYYDTNGDDFLSSLDALLVINALNTAQGSGEGEQGATLEWAFPVQAPSARKEHRTWDQLLAELSHEWIVVPDRD